MLREEACAISLTQWAKAIEADEDSLEVGETDILDVSGNSTLITSLRHLMNPGCYTWIEELWQGEELLLVTPPGIESETTLIPVSTIASQISVKVLADTFEVKDSIDVANLKGDAIIEAVLYDPMNIAAEQSCTQMSADDWAKAVESMLEKESIRFQWSCLWGCYLLTPPWR